MLTGNEQKINKWRCYFWPIYPKEQKKIISLLIIFFCIAMNYNLLKNLKDSLIMTAPNSSAQVIPFIKVWVMLPMSFVMTYVFTQFANKQSLENVFYSMITLFLICFIFFAVFIYPKREMLFLYKLDHYLQLFLPKGLKGIIIMIKYWPLTFFYLIAELWSNIVLSLLLWGFANSITTIDESKRFYAILGFGANSAGLFSSPLAIYVLSLEYNKALKLGSNSTEQAFYLQIFLILIFGIIAIAIFKYLHLNVLKKTYSVAAQDKKSQDKNHKMSLLNSFQYLFRSKYLMNIAIIVLAYNLSVNLIEVIWKEQLRLQFPHGNDYNIFMSYMTFCTSILATFGSIFVANNLIRKFGWTFCAMITPIVDIITGSIFFLFMFCKQNISNNSFILGLTPLFLSVLFGAAHNCLSRASKYTILDITKEMAFVPLNHEIKIRGKAAIDGVGSRLGKSSGSLFLQLLWIFFPTINLSAPYVAVILFSTAFFWIVSVKKLGNSYKMLINN